MSTTLPATNRVLRQAVYTAPAKASAKANTQSIVFLVFAVDLLLVTLSIVGAFLLRFHSPLNEFGFVPVQHPFQDYAGHLVVGVVSLMALLTHAGFYQADALLSHRRVSSKLWRSTAIWFLGYMAASLILKFEPQISRVFCVLAFVMVLISLGTWRSIILKMAGKVKALECLRKRVLFVGWNESSHNLYQHILSDSRQLNEVVGVIPLPGTDDFEHSPPKKLRQMDASVSMHDLFRRYDVDTVMVTDTRIGGDDIVDLSNTCEKDMVDFKLIPTGFQTLLSGLHLEHVAGVPVLGVSKLPLQFPLNSVLKRAMDLLGGVVGLMISAPIMFVLAIIIKRESPGPVFYRQRRVGCNGQHFTIFKLRSMRLDSETASGARWAQKDDPRCLRIGAIMRKWNLDELPQFWNVLTGDMSLVGPRPERPELIMGFKDTIPHYNARHNIKPGMTGWAQVNGLRGNTDLTERVKYDLFYIENWSFALDWQIMLFTMKNRENAY